MVMGITAAHGAFRQFPFFLVLSFDLLSISQTWKMDERIITAVFAVGFLKFYDPSVTAYKDFEKPNNPWRKVMEVVGPSLHICALLSHCWLVCLLIPSHPNSCPPS